MTVRFVTGRAGTGKTKFIINEMKDASINNPFGEAIFFIVPDQMTFSMEKALSTVNGMNGIVRTQVTTFKRLAWRILQEVGGISKEEVSGYGYQMLLRKILQEQQSNLSLFRLAATKRGFTENLSQLLKELSRYAVDTHFFANTKAQIDESNAPETLKQKMHDLSLIMNKVEDRLGDTHVDGEGYMKLLHQNLHLSNELHNAHIYVDGFLSMTTRDREILGELMKKAERVTIVLPIDNEQVDSIDEQSIFYTAAQTKRKLTELAQQFNVSVEDTIHLTDTTKFQSKELAHLEKQLQSYPAETIQSEGNIVIIEAENRRAEIHAVAREIRKLVRDEGYRYRDIAILYRQASEYDDLLRHTLKAYDIPVFINNKRPMLHHPLIEWTRSIIEVILTNFAYEPVMRALKTDLFIPLNSSVRTWRERTDQLENFILAHGIYGGRWYDEKRWFVKNYRGLEFFTQVQTDEEKAKQQEIESVKNIFLAVVDELKSKIGENPTGQQIATAIFETAESMQLFDKLQKKKDDDEAAGRLLEAKEHDQAWNGFLTVLDQFVLLFGDEERTLQDAFVIFEEGLDQLEFSRIPSSVDEVTVGAADLARLTNIKASFVIGLNDGVYPKRAEQEGLLSDAEREFLTTLGVELGPTSRMRLMDEQYVMYRAITSASHKLFFTYPMADEEGRALLPSMYEKRIVEIISGVNKSFIAIDPSELDGDVSNYFEHPKSTISYVANKMRHVPIEQFSKEWKEASAFLHNDPLWHDVLTFVTGPLRKDVRAKKIDEDTTIALYGDTLSSSVSRVEKYFSCAFSHFATYGLRLSDRDEYRLEAPAIGDLFHESLKWIGEKLKAENRSWASLSKEETWQWAKQAVEAITPYFMYQILVSTKRHLYIQRKLVQILSRTIRTLSKHASVSEFQPVALEVGFGHKELLPPLEINIEKGRMLRLRGRIDRIDSYEKDDKAYLRIVDFKSSAKKLDLSEVYYGLSLQMLTYLDVAVSNANILLQKDADPAGVLYVHMHNPMIATNDFLGDSELEETIMKRFKMSGLLIDDPDIVRKMDEQIEGYSTVIPVAIKKDGSFYSNSSIVSKEDMDYLRKFTRLKHEEAANGIYSGETAVAPMRIKNKTSCDYCNLRSICQFEPTNEDQQYRVLTPFSSDYATAKIRQEVQSNANSDEAN